MVSTLKFVGKTFFGNVRFATGDVYEACGEGKHNENSYKKFDACRMNIRHYNDAQIKE